MLTATVCPHLQTSACRNSRRDDPPTRNRRRSILLFAFSVIMVFMACRTAESDETPAPDYYDGWGIMGRLDHIEGQGIPQIQSITPLQLFPYLMSEQNMFFADMRVYPTNQFTFGGNAGVGYRYYSESLDRVFGISGWYDGDNTRNLLFQQLGLSLESYAGPFDVRSNLYLPVGPTSRQSYLNLISGSTQFQGDNLFYSQNRWWTAALKGFDAEAGIPIPGEFSDEHGLRVYGGGYHFSDDQGDSITGASGRIQANLVGGLDAQVQVTYDNFFKTRAFVGVSYTFGALHRSEMKQTTAYGRMGEHVTRNYTVVAEGHSAVERRVAVDPSTGLPYTFAHVSSAAAPGGNGSVNSPFQTIAAAQMTGRNIVFVGAGSVFTGGPSVVLNAGQRVLGDGPTAQYYVRVPNIGSLLLPHGPTVGANPILNNSLGDAVVLASNSEFSGFSITNPTRNGIVGTGVQNVIINNVSVAQSGIDGFQLNNTSGPISITNAFVSNAGGSGIDIQGGTGLIQFLGTTTVSAATGPAVLINNLASAGVVNFNSLGIDHRQGMGLEIDNSAGTVNVNTASISNEVASAASALDIENSSGNFNLNQVNISAATGAPAVKLQNDTGTTSFSILNVASTNGTALFAHSAGNLFINQTVNNLVNLSQGGVISAVNGTALDFQGTNLNVNLSSVSSSNAATAGISLIGTSGSLEVTGNGTPGSGGLIQGGATGILLNNTGQSSFQWMTINGNGVGISAQNAGSLGVLNSSITNSTSFGISTQNLPTLMVLNSVFGGNGGANIQGQFSQVGTYAYSVVGSTLTSGTADNLVLTTLAGGQGSTMNLFAQNDAFTNTMAGTGGIRAGWNGGLTAFVDSSTFAQSGGTNTGVSLANASTTGLTTIAITNNQFQSAGSGDFGVNLTTNAPSQITIFDNLAQFNAANGTGFQMSLGPSATVNVSSNTINDSIGGATGIHFSSITGPGSVTINNNIMNLTNTGVFPDQGIIFSSVTGTIQLIGTQNNGVINAATPFFVPVGTTTGSILVNGIPVP